jgi:hypothetical protein
VIVIDDAERLDSDHVDHLENFVVLRGDTGLPLFTFVLIANLALHHAQTGMALQRWLDPSRVLHVPLAPLSSREICGYLGARMRRVGWSGEAPFTAEAAVRLHELTGGVPGALNELARRLLAGAVQTGRREVTREWIDECVVAAPVELDSDRPATAPASRSRIDVPGRSNPGRGGSVRRRASAHPRSRSRGSGSRPREPRPGNLGATGRVGRWLVAAMAVAAVATALWSGRVMVAAAPQPSAVASPPPR